MPLLQAKQPAPATTPLQAPRFLSPQKRRHKTPSQVLLSLICLVRPFFSLYRRRETSHPPPNNVANFFYFLLHCNVATADSIDASSHTPSLPCPTNLNPVPHTTDTLRHPHQHHHTNTPGTCHSRQEDAHDVLGGECLPAYGAWGMGHGVCNRDDPIDAGGAEGVATSK